MKKEISDVIMCDAVQIENSITLRKKDDALFNYVHIGLKDAFFVAKHLYFTSDEYIYKGDYWINMDNNKVSNDELLVDIADNTQSCKKIIASTDLSLELPVIPVNFVNLYVTEYNKKKVIKKVMVVIEEFIDLTKMNGENLEELPSVRVTVETFSDHMYSEEEVIRLLHKYESDMIFFGRDGYFSSCFPKATDDWFDNNKKK